uniref:Hst-3.1 n=1 Tax=Pristionchus pacificus TaxID=54126 RepID=A0A2A6CTX2_PRIPA|eukprot:PDM81536.1 hst-3.1 [Pristionchus pacificus]
MMARCGRVAVIASGLLGSLALIALIEIFSFELSTESGITSTQPLTMARRAMSSLSDAKILPSRHFPSALLIGVRKGGTRALLDALALHPQIKAARREVHYFDDEMNYGKGEEWYLQQMPFSRNEITIEKTPAYFTNPLVPERVYRMNPAMKIILIIREPVTRAISDFTQVYYNRLELNKSLPVFSELAFTREGQIEMSYKPVSFQGDHRSQICSQLALRIAFEAMAENISPEPDIGARWRYICEGPSQSTSTSGRLSWFTACNSRQPTHFQSFEGLSLLPEDIIVQGSLVKCLGRSKGRPHREIDDKTQQHLARLLRPHNRVFFQMINRVFPW